MRATTGTVGAAALAQSSLLVPEQHQTSGVLEAQWPCRRAGQLTPVDSLLVR